MTQITVVVLDDWEGASLASTDWSPLEARASIDVRREPIVGGEQAVIDALVGADVVVVMRERTALPARVIDSLPRLRLIVTTGVRNASIDLAACQRAGITVCHTGPGTGPVVELAWALILAAARGLPAVTSAMREGGWPAYLGRDLRGARLGLLGLGRTGQRMAEIAAAFGMPVSAWSPHLTPERAAEHGADYVSRDELFRGSDIVSLHLVLAESTRAIVGARELAALGPDSWLVNTSRGPLVDEGALVHACAQGLIAGALLDVFDAEPLPADHRLRTTPRVVLTPHLGYVTRENLSTWYADVVEDIVRWLDGDPVRVAT